MKRLCKKLFVLLLFPALQLHAQDTLTIEQAVAAALKNNYDILLLKNDSAVFALNNSYSYAAFLPRLNATGGLIFNNNAINQKLSDGTERKRGGIRSENLAAAINMNWTIFDGFKLFATRQRLAELVRLGELNIKEQIVNTVSEIIKTYYNIVRRKQQMRAIEEQMKLNEDRVILAEKRLSVGLGAKPEVLQAKVDLNAQKAAQLAEITLQEQLKEQLNLLVAFKQGTNYEVTDSIPIEKNINFNDVLTKADKFNPAVLTAEQNIKIANLVLKERRADRYPIVSFNSAYNFNRVENTTVVNSFTPLFNRNSGYNYGLGVSIPIFNGFTVKRQIQEAKLDIENREILFDYRKFQTEIAVSTAYKDYLLQQKTLALEEENIVLAKENVFIASERLRLGITTVLELREAQRSLEAAYNRLITARYNTKVAETELKKLQGTIVEDAVK